jgi:YggT family protein
MVSRVDLTSFVAASTAALRILRYVVAGAAAVTGIVCLGDWLVRTRRLNPFGRTARFFRSVVDPVIAPVERRVVRAGGLPSAAPWWALVTAVVGGIVLLTLVDALRALVLRFLFAADQGPRQIIVVLVAWAFELLEIALIVRVLSSWVRISPYSAWIRWSFVLTDWLLTPLRRIIPPLGMVDITPIVAYFALQLAQSAVIHYIA